MKTTYLIFTIPIVLIVLALIIWLSSYTIVPVEIALAPTPTAAPTPIPTLTPGELHLTQTKAYKDPIAGLSFRYPLNWQVSNIKPGLSALLTEQTLEATAATIQIQISPATQDLTTYINQTYPNISAADQISYPLAPSIPGVQIISPSTTTYLFIHQEQLYQFNYNYPALSESTPSASPSQDQSSILNNLIATISLSNK